MRSAARAIALALLLLPSFVAAQEPRARIDPGIRRLLQPQVREALRREPPPLAGVAAAAPEPSLPPGLVEPAPRRLEGGLALAPSTGGDLRVGVLMRLATPGVVADVRAAGAEIGTIVGSIATAWVPLEALPRVVAIAGVERIEAARTLAAVHDTSMIVIRADSLRTLVNGVWSGAAGHGVIVGIYDTGLDLHHDDFRDEQGRTRVVGVWDQINSVRSPPPGFTQGFYCTQDAVQRRIDGDNAACPQTDTFGHGTHVAGTAAGDGSAGSPAFRFTGVAPAADLLIVRGGQGSFSENLIIEGLAFMKAQAAARGQPAVANLSLGGQYGPHDGTRLYEQAIDDLSGPGFVVVISAGNFGSNANTTPPLPERLIHARGVPVGVQTAEFTIDLCRDSNDPTCEPYVPSSNRCGGHVVDLDFWYEAQDRLRIEVARPNGSLVSAARGASAEHEDPTGRVLIDNGTTGVNPENGDVEAIITIDGCGTAGRPQAGTWTIRVTPEVDGSGQPYDMWIYRSVLGLDGTSRGRIGFDNRHVVSSPGNATRAITVGAFVTKVCWASQSTTGQSCYNQRETVGDLARFSAAGPRRDQLLKPEITAPGIGIASARSRDFSVSSTRLTPDGQHWVLEGTSMSAPHVTGAVAILLQANPTLDPEGVKTLLSTTAIRDAFTERTYGALSAGATPSDWWGAGKLNVRDALRTMGGAAPAVLAIGAEDAVPDTAVLGRRGNRLSLLALTLESRGTEAIDVLGLSFDVAGTDPAARLLLVRDVDGDRVADAAEPVLGAATLALHGAVVRVQITPDSLRVPAAGAIDVVVALELSGAAPHGATFEAALVPGATLSIGATTLMRNPLDVQVVASSGTAETSLLRSDQPLSLSENPVRGSSVHFTFAEPPTAAAIYTVTGRRAADLMARLAGERHLEWDLTNDDGARVAPGVYLIAFTVGGRTHTEKLIVLTPGADPSGNPE